MSEHHVSVTVNAPVHQVYTLFTHFNDFPKFMSFVKEVTYYDEQRSHWVVDVAGTQEWDAVNEGWVPDRQIGWRSINGLANTGVVKFTAVGPERTLIDVYISYRPPAGLLGAAVEQAGYGHFEEILHRDLEHFARMVEHAPPGALDPMRSHYLFHDESAVARGQATERQREAMQHDPMMQTDALQKRAATIESEVEERRQATQAQEERRKVLASQQQQATREQSAALQRQAKLDREEAEARQAAQAAQTVQPREPHPVYDTIGGRNASMDRTAFGDLDAQSERFPGYREDPMLSRAPGTLQQPAGTSLSDTEIESPWRAAGPGQPPMNEQVHSDQTEQQHIQQSGQEPQGQQNIQEKENTEQEL